MIQKHKEEKEVTPKEVLLVPINGIDLFNLLFASELSTVLMILLYSTIPMPFNPALQRLYCIH